MQKRSRSVFSQSKNGVYIIAEIGGNHEGNFEYAKRLTRLAAESGADAIKFQIYTGDTLVNPILDPGRNEHFKRFQLKKEEYINLAKLCGNLGTSFMASVWDSEALDYIDEYIVIYKIGSGDLTAYNIIKEIIEKRKPIILSTGLSTLEEVLQTVHFIEGIDPSYTREKKLALLQCSSMYPIPDSDAHLNAMITLREKTGLPVGYSDHTVGMDAVETAVAMGAELIEMHFTDTRENKSFRDHEISVTKEEIHNFIEKVKRIRILQGNFGKTPVPSEIESNHILSFRRAIYPLRDLKAGSLLKEGDLITLRPNIGIPAHEFYNLIGKRLKVDVKKYQRLNWDVLE